MTPLITSRLHFAAALLVVAGTLTSARADVLFALRQDSDDVAIEPIAMVTKTEGACDGCWRVTFAAPPRGKTSESPTAEAGEFAARYYRPGRTYRILAGGAEAGEAKVEKQTLLGCISLAASVEVTPSLPRTDWRGAQALAIGSLHVTPRTAARAEPAAAEEQALWSLAEDAFRTREVPAGLLADMEGGNFASIDLNRDGTLDVIGSFAARDAQARITHRLFLIASRDETGGYHTEHVWYFRFDEQNEGHTDLVRLVDTIDLDEDGTDEVIVEHVGYESHDYAILKRSRDGKWTRVYRGGGSGC
jgi:hypothetical protein